MGGIGCRPDDSVRIVKEITSLEAIMLEGICSHFPMADEENKEFTNNQINIFTKILNQIQEEGIDIPLKHISNSASVIRFPDAAFNMIRPRIIS